MKLNPNNGTRLAISYPIKIEDIVDELHNLAIEVEKAQGQGYTPTKVIFYENWNDQNFKLVVVVEDKRLFILDEHDFSSQF